MRCCLLLQLGPVQQYRCMVLGDELLDAPYVAGEFEPICCRGDCGETEAIRDCDEIEALESHGVGLLRLDCDVNT